MSPDFLLTGEVWGRDYIDMAAVIRNRMGVPVPG